MYLVIALFGGQALLLEDHPASKERHQKTVACVAEHDSKQEGKGDDRVRGRVHFPVRSYAVGVDQVLESVRELAGVVVSRWILAGFHPVQDGRHGTSAALLKNANNVIIICKKCNLSWLYLPFASSFYR